MTLKDSLPRLDAWTVDGYFVLLIALAHDSERLYTLRYPSVYFDAKYLVHALGKFVSSAKHTSGWLEGLVFEL